MYIIRVRRATTQEWIDNNPILMAGELGYDIDRKMFKVGNGKDPWNDLSDVLGQGPQGIQGPVGPQGPIGPGIVVRGNVASSTNLPASANVNDLYITNDTGHGWVWDGTKWIDTGPIRGPQGVDGTNGAPGPQGIQGPAGPQGQPGPAGAAGIWWSGTQAQYDAIPSKDPNTLYVVTG